MVQYGAIDHVPPYNLSCSVVLFFLIAPLVSYLLWLYILLVLELLKLHLFSNFIQLVPVLFLHLSNSVSF